MPNRLREFFYAMPVRRRDASMPPVKRGFEGNPQVPGERRRATEKLDDVIVVEHDESTLRPVGVGVKHVYAAKWLDSEVPAGAISTMRKIKASRSDAELEWQRECGKRVRWVRELAEWSQEYMAAVLEIKQQRYSSYETGRNVPDPWIMLRFCARMRTTLDYVYRARLEGTHPVLAKLLLKRHPELNDSNHTETGTDTALTAYKEAIRES